MNFPRRESIAALALFVAACNLMERRNLNAQLAKLERRRADLSFSYEQRKRAVERSQDDVRGLKADLALHNTETLTYIDRHRESVACIRAARVSIGQDNTYGARVSYYVRFMAVACTILLFDDRFASDVRDVGRHLETADSLARKLKARIATLDRTIKRQRVELKKASDALRDVDLEIAALRRRIDAL